LHEIVWCNCKNWRHDLTLASQRHEGTKLHQPLVVVLCACMGSIRLKDPFLKKVRVCMCVCCQCVPNIKTPNCNLIYCILLKNHSWIWAEVLQQGEWSHDCAV
jgi:hypothetical protein